MQRNEKRKVQKRRENEREKAARRGESERAWAARRSSFTSLSSLPHHPSPAPGEAILVFFQKKRGHFSASNRVNGEEEQSVVRAPCNAAQRSE
jgi:hypothetical protein